MKSPRDNSIRDAVDWCAFQQENADAREETECGRTPVPENNDISYRLHKDILLGWLTLLKGDPAACEKLIPLVEDLLSSLPWQESTVLRMRYGIEDGYPRSNVEIAESMQITLGRVYELEKSALSKLYRQVMLQDVEFQFRSKASEN